MTTIYDIEVVDESGNPYTLERYKGQAMMIVNTATKCGLRGQFSDLEALYKKYQNQGFVVLGFPSNQFHQEVSDGQEAAESCRLSYGVSFPMHEIIAVNGKEAHPLFTYLKKAQGGMLSDAIKWNFTKFLVDKDGHVIKRYGPQTSPLDATADIEAIL
ncbi:glutathione peroxidase [Enterococcus sp. AZ150]|uniref:glutathione peroxidase n=1 Tax=Enterococcus sp. AZ150 TaxID=2774866 RepID=UPI003F24F224